MVSRLNLYMGLIGIILLSELKSGGKAADSSHIISVAFWRHHCVLINRPILRNSDIDIKDSPRTERASVVHGDRLNQMVETDQQQTSGELNAVIRISHLTVSAPPHTIGSHLSFRCSPTVSLVHGLNSF